MIRGGKLIREFQDDAEGYGMFGLLDAAKKFDPSNGVPFEAYAAIRIRGAVLDGLRRNDHLSRSTRAKVSRGEREDVRVTSLDAIRGDGGDLHDAVGRSDLLPDDPDFWRAATSRLPSRERRAVLLYFRDGMAMREVGELLGYSETSVSHWIESAIANLRADAGLADRLGVAV